MLQILSVFEQKVLQAARAKSEKVKIHTLTFK